MENSINIVVKKNAQKRTAGAREKTEEAAEALFAFCAAAAVLALVSVTVYLLFCGIPAIREVGLMDILFGTVWDPTAREPKFGILLIVLTSLVGTLLAVAVGVPVGILTAVFLAEVAGPKTAWAVRGAVDVLAGIPSVIYGLVGIYLLNPLMYRVEMKLFASSPAHRFTGGANLLSAALVLAVMILPTVISISEASVRAVGPEIREASLALGATRIQTIFRSVLPAARPGIITAAVLGVGRAMGEAMAITLVSGGSINIPFPFRSVRFLTTAIVSEMGYAQGLHRQMLFAVGLVLFVFILLINMAAEIIRKGYGERDG